MQSFCHFWDILVCVALFDMYFCHCFALYSTSSISWRGKLVVSLILWIPWRHPPGKEPTESAWKGEAKRGKVTGPSHVTLNCYNLLLPVCARGDISIMTLCCRVHQNFCQSQTGAVWPRTRGSAHFLEWSGISWYSLGIASTLSDSRKRKGFKYFHSATPGQKKST